MVYHYGQLYRSVGIEALGPGYGKSTSFRVCYPVSYHTEHEISCNLMNPLSVILHCDLDCFYAQVERERLGLPKDAALAVIQWSSALAVSYPARHYGIKRGSTLDDIKRLAPNDVVKVVHVETISTDVATDSSNGYASTQERRPNQQTEKVSLARYRRASAQVFEAMNSEIAKMHPKTVLERASIDEAYIDVSAEVERRLRHGFPVPSFSEDTHVEGTGNVPFMENNDEPVDNDLSVDRPLSNVSKDGLTRLAFGAAIAKQLRQHVASECGYTMSAGVSVNKLVAKFASAAHKPNQQTVVPVHAVFALLDNVPLTRIRGLGGKLGREISFVLNGFDESKRDEIVTAGETRRLSVDGLQRLLKCEPKTASFVYRSVRGLDDTPVMKRGPSQSLLAAKSFAPENELSSVRRMWLPLLATELTNRLEEDGRIANKLTISFRATQNGKPPFIHASRAIRMPTPSGNDHSLINAIVEAAINTLKTALSQENRFTLPINFIGLTANDFVQRVSEREQISQFFVKSSQPKTWRISKLSEPTELKNPQPLNENAATDPTSKSELDNNLNIEKQNQKIQEKVDRKVALKLQREETITSLQNRRHVQLVESDKRGTESTKLDEQKYLLPCSSQSSPLNSSRSSELTGADKAVKFTPVPNSDLHQRRLQEKADRVFALKLHREESSRGIQKSQKNNSSKASTNNRLPGKSPKRPTRGSKELNGVAKIDCFFKTQD